MMAKDGGESGYREYPVPPALAEHLVCVWSSVVPAAPLAASDVLPDACSDIVVVGDREPVVAGPATLPVHVAHGPGTVIVGARFRPGRSPAWLHVRADQMLNQDVPLRDLWGPEADRLRGRVAAAPSPAARRNALVGVLLERLGAVRLHDPMVEAAIHWLAAHPGGRVDALSRHLAVSPRQLNRRTAFAVGYGPKTLQRILRLQRLMIMMADPRTNPGSLAALAAFNGYADQPHLAREVRELTGSTATVLGRTSTGTLRLSDLFRTGPSVRG